MNRAGYNRSADLQRQASDLVTNYGFDLPLLEGAIWAALEAERERCAKVAEHLNGWGDDHGKGGHAEHIAACIRKSDSRGYDIGAPEEEDAA